MSELFETHLNFLPVLETGETLFSWGARYHRRCGNACAQDSSLLLYGDRWAGVKHDLPSHVARLASAIGVADQAESLIYKHSIFGAFAKFLSPEVTQVALQMMLGTSIAGLKHRLGLLKSGVGADHPLKACHYCTLEDSKSAVGATWRLEHQWPTVWICKKHCLPLSYLDVGFLKRQRSLWPLPDSVSKSAWVEYPLLQPSQIAHLKRIAELTSALAAIEERNLDLSHLRLTYLLGAMERGFVVTSDASLRFGAMLAAVRQRFDSLLDLPGWKFLVDTASVHGGFVGLLMRNYRGNHHFTKHLALIDFLFDSFFDFRRVYDLVENSSNQGAVDELYCMLRITRQNVLDGVVSGSRSINSVAQEFGVPVSRAVSWIKSEGVSYKARPRVLTPEKTEKLLQMLKEGKSRTEIVEDLNIKRGWLRAYLAKNKDLRDSWFFKVYVAKRDHYRNELINFVSTHGALPVARIKKIPSSRYLWLFKHDSEWLALNAPSFFGG